MRILMITIPWATEDLICAPYISQQIEFLRRAGIESEIFCFRGEKNPMNYLRAWRRMHERFILKEFDLIHAQHGQSGLLSFPKQLPLVVTFHGSDLLGTVSSSGRYSLSSPLLRLASRSIARLANEVIIVSKQMVKHLPRRSYHVIPMGVDLEKFQPIPQEEARKQLGLPLDKRLILFAASPSKPVKRYHLAQKAVTLLDSKYGAKLIVTSHVPHHIMPLYMNACDALLLTSKHEGSPTIVKEALACNLPIVSVDVGDVRQRIGSLNGCLISQDDLPDTLAAGLSMVLARKQRIEGKPLTRDLDETELTSKVISVYKRAMLHS